VTSTSELFSRKMPVGRVYSDNSRKTHDAYGIDCDEGGVVVLRPDGYIGTVVSLDDDTNCNLKVYFQDILRPEEAVTSCMY
jgi:phenol 2-monooxygenase